MVAWLFDSGKGDSMKHVQKDFDGMRIVFLILLSTVVICPGSGFGQACGTPPPANIQWSENFQKAVLKILSSSNQTNESGDLSAITEDGFLDFGFKSDNNTTQNARDQLSIQQAEQFVQEEYKNKSAQIIAECGYRMCTLAAQPSGIVATAGLANVCSVAFNNGEVPAISSGLQSLPSAIPFIFRGGQKSTLYTAVLANNTQGSVTVIVPNHTDFVSVVSPSNHEIKIASSRYAMIKFRLLRPSLESGPVTQQLIFRDHDNLQAAATFTFTLVPDESDLYPPASIPCGSINPKLNAIAYSDDPGRGPKSDTRDGWISIPAGDQSGLSSVAEDYTNNGNGHATAALDTSCTQLITTQTEVLTIMRIKPHLWAKAGHCCSGFGPGGEAAANPQWKTTITLPGNADKAHWHLTITPSISTAFPARTCSLQLDGGMPLTINSTPVPTFELTAGVPHLIEEQCTSSKPWGVRPGNWDTEGTVKEDVDLTLHATRMSGTVSVAANH